MRITRNKTAAATLPNDPAAAPFPVVIAALGPDAGCVQVQRRPDAVPLSARVAIAPPYRPAVGDRVLLTSGGDANYVIGVLSAVTSASAAKEAPIPLPDGGAVHIHGQTV